MRIFVKNILTRKITTVDVEHSDKIDDVKRKIQEQKVTMQSPQGLMYSGKFLERDRELWEYNIQDGSTLEFILAFSVPSRVLNLLSGKKNGIVEENDPKSHDSKSIDFEFEFHVDLDLDSDSDSDLDLDSDSDSDLDSSVVSRAERTLESRKTYDPIKHQTQIQEILNKELVSMISHDGSNIVDDASSIGSNLVDDASSIHEEIKEIKNLEAGRDATWDMIPWWY